MDSSIARIQFTLNALERRPNGAVVGSIWVGGDTPGAAFPEMDWSDFPVALLATWLPALRRLAARGQTAECHFMDGPYHFTVTAAVPGEWRVACFEHREGSNASNAAAEWATTQGEFVESAIGAARSILGHCDARGWWDADTDRLRTALTAADPNAAS